MTSASPVARRLGPALAASAVIVGSAPILGKGRDFLLASFGVRFLVFLAAGLAGVGLVAFTAVLVRVRNDRPRRYGLLALAIVLVALQVGWWRSGDQRVDLVERVHVVEYGGLALLFYRAFAARYQGFASAAVTLLAVGTVGVADELVQWWSPIRTGDQRDVWLNLFAATIGLLVARALASRDGREPGLRGGAAALWASAALFLASFGLLCEGAHCGYVAGDDEIRFRSFFRAEWLPALAVERARRWQGTPPTLSAYGREDFFLTEAAWHVQARNAAFEAGDWTGAWVENRILELWYPPFLDLRSFQTGVPHRWPAAQLERVEAGRSRPLPGAPGPYWSPVLAERIWLEPRVSRVRWGTFGGAALAALAALVSRRRALRLSGRP